jgi:hypothetical protein
MLRIAAAARPGNDSKVHPNIFMSDIENNPISAL